MNRLEIIDLKKTYGTHVALDCLNLQLENGIYGLLGQNGAGKSTLMGLITDNLKRDSGSILYQGEEILHQKRRFRQALGYMPQQQGFYGEFSAKMFLLYIAGMKGLKKSEAVSQTEYLLNRVNLGDVKDKKLAEFSGGMRQRVLLAQALLGEPQILLLDEPTAGLDPRERIRIRNLIAELSEQRIILLATHVVGDVECIADQIIFLRRGRLVSCGKPGELIAEAQGHIFERHCEKSELTRLMKDYPNGNLIQKSDGLYLRIASGSKDDGYEGFQAVQESIGLEEAYLYYERER